MQKQNYLDTALKYHAAGLRIIPFGKKDGQTAFPPGGWKQYLTSQTEEEVRALFAAPADGVALLCTGGLEGVDIDVKHDPAGTIAEEYFAHVKTFEGGEAILKKCLIQKTKSAGYHIIYRAGNVEGNQKLARRKGSPEAVIETRGPGGLLFISPSPGYKVERGDFLQIPEITEEERDILILAARELDERAGAGNESRAPGAPALNNRQEESEGEDLRPGDDFNRQHDVLEVLEGYGWRVVKEHGGREYLNRPGNPEQSKVNASIVTTKTGERVFFPFTTATAFDAERCYNAFAVYAIEEHGGRFDDAARALRAKGYGSERASETTTRAADEPGPAKLYGMGESTPEALVLVQERESAEAAKAAGLLGVVAIDGAALTSKQIAGAIAGGAKRFTLCFGNTPAALEAERQTVEALLRYHEAQGAAFWVFVAQIPGGSLAALLGAVGGIDAARAAMGEAKSAATYLAEFFGNIRAPEIARQHTGGRLDKDILRPYFKEEITALWRLLPTSETGYFEHLLSDVLEGYFLTWGEIKHDAQTLREREAERRYLQTAAKISEAAAALFRDGKNEEGEAALREIAKERSRAGAGKFAELLEGQTREAFIGKLRNKSDKLQTGYFFKRKGMEAEPLEIPAAGITVIGGSTGHGKSTFLINLLLDVCGRYPEKEFHFFTLEESEEAQAAKALNCFCDLHLSARNAASIEAYLTSGTEEFIETKIRLEFQAREAKFWALLGKQIFFHYPQESTAEFLTGAIRHLNRRGNVGGVFVDYFQLLSLENAAKIRERTEQLKAICLTVKDAAIETGLPLIFAAQFNRQVTREEDLDFRKIGEAGDIERVAALVVGLWDRTQTAEVWKVGDDGKRENISQPRPEIFAKIMKHRGGPVNGEGAFDFDGNRAKIYQTKPTTSAASGRQTSNKSPY